MQTLLLLFNRRTVLAAIFLYAFCSVSLSQTIELRLPAGRAGSSFNLQRLGYYTELPAVLSAGFVEGTTPASSYFAIILADSLQDGSSFGDTLYLQDQTFGDWFSVNANGTGVYNLVGTYPLLRNEPGVWNGFFYEYEWTINPFHHFLVPPARSGNQFLLAQGGAFAPVSRMPVTVPLLTNDSATSGQEDARARIWGQFVPGGGPVSIVDLTTAEQSLENESNLLPQHWTPLHAAAPAVAARFILAPEHVGQTFTLHAKAPGGPVQMQSLTAEVWSEATSGGSGLAVDYQGSTFSLKPHAVSVVGVVGVGMEFWLTRDGDGATLGPFTHTQEGMIGTNPAVYNCQSVLNFRLPQQQWIYPSFTIAASRYTHTIALKFGDGELHVLHDGSGYDGSDDPGFGTMYSYDAWGNYLSHLQTFWCGTDWPSDIPFQLVDLTTGEHFPPGTSEVLDGWTAHNRSQPSGTVRLSLFSGWRDRPLRLQWWEPSVGAVQGELNIPTGIGETYTFTLQDHQGDIGAGAPVQATVEERIFEKRGPNNELLYSLNYFEVLLPLGASDFRVVDVITGNIAPLDPSSSQNLSLKGRTNLIEWFPAPADKYLNISSSRWGHELYLCHPNGAKFPIQQNATQGNLSFDPNQLAWWTSYYYFDAKTLSYDFLGWWIEDSSMRDANGMPERSSLNPANCDLVHWIALPKPKELSGESLNMSGIKLCWSKGVSSVDGAFILERCTDDFGPWQTIATISAGDVDAEGFLSFEDHTLYFGHVYSYRVSYTFGGQVSAPSDVLRVRSWKIFGDGFPYPWDPNGDPDEDGLTNLQEFLAGTDPFKKDNPALNLSAFGFIAP